MNRLADEKNERRKVQKRDTALSYIKVVLYVLGFLSCLYTLKQYNFTLIDFKTTFLIGFAPALLATFVLERNYKYYLFCVVVFSYFFSGAFFLVNNLSGSNVMEVRLPIIGRSKVRAVSSRSSPWVIINYDGVTKDVYSDTEDEKLFKEAKTIKLMVKKGLFGYYIIKERELRRE